MRLTYNKKNPRLTLAILFAGLTILLPEISSGQNKLDSIRFSKQLYVSYGGVFTGNGDMWGHKVFVGANYMVSDRFGVDLNIAGQIIDHIFYEYNNREWSRNEVSNGLEFSANGIFTSQKERLRFYVQAGPTVRYAYDQFASDYGIDYNPGTGEYDWRIEYEKHQGFMFGFNTGITLDLKVYNRFYIGPKASMSFFPFDDYRFSYIGLNLAWK